MIDNVAVLRARGVHIVEPEAGRLAGGDVGAGRLADPAAIVAAVERVLGPRISMTSRWSCRQEALANRSTRSG